MNSLSPKLRELSAKFADLPPVKLNTFLQLVSCILAAGSCNLRRCAMELPGVVGDAGLGFDTAYARLKRVFQSGRGEALCKAVFFYLLELLPVGEDVLLIIDRTDFKIRGTTWVNLLVLGMEWHGVFIPLVWKDLGRRGNSDQRQRTALLDRLLEWWRQSGRGLPVFCLTADREFTGMDWLRDLERRGLRYVIRVKSCLRFEVWHDGAVRARKCSGKVLARYLRRHARGRVEVVLKGTVITGLVRFEQEDPQEKEPYVLLLTNLADPAEAQGVYRRRWPIESCFGHQKKRGYDLEATHLEGAHKLDILFAAVTLAYALSIKEGVEKDHAQQVKSRRFPRGKTYKRISLFAYGHRLLKATVHRLIELLDRLLLHTSGQSPPIILE